MRKQFTIEEKRAPLRLCGGLLACLFLLFCVLSAMPLRAAAEEQETGFSAINAAAAYCVDTEQVLYESRGEETFAPGILTKIAALMVARDILTDCGVSLSEEVTIKQSWVQGTYISGDRSSPYLQLMEGETYTLEYLFATTLVANANDSCASIVHYCAETLMYEDEAAFLKKMNEKAQALGLTNTTFGDTIGFGGLGRTTVTDAVRLTAAFYRYDDLVQLSNRESYGSIHNKNYLKSNFVVDGYLMEDAIGLLAGQATDQGNYCVLTACERDGIAYVFAVMGAPSMRVDVGEIWFDPGNAYEDMLGMVPYVMNSFGYMQLCRADDMLAELRLGNGAEKDFLLLVPAQSIELMVFGGAGSTITPQITYNEEKVYDSEVNGKLWKTVDAPVKQGDVLGVATYMQDGKVLATVDLIAMESVDTDTLKTTFTKLKEFLFDGAMGKLIKIILIIIAIWLGLTLVVLAVRFGLWVRRREKRKDRKDLEERSQDVNNL